MMYIDQYIYMTIYVEVVKTHKPRVPHDISIWK